MREYMFPQHYPKTYARFKPEPGESLGVHLGKLQGYLLSSSLLMRFQIIVLTCMSHDLVLLDLFQASEFTHERSLLNDIKSLPSFQFAAIVHVPR